MNAVTQPTQPRPDAHAARSHGDESGFVLVWFALMLVVLVGMAGFGVDVWNWWYTGQEAQRAADSAALGGVVFLPGDEDSAESTAIDIASANEFIDGAGSTVVAAADAANQNRLRVTISKPVENVFGGIFGIDTTTITRTAVAEYQGPVPLGSPTNNLCDQPTIPTVSQWLTSPVTPVNTSPRCWVNIAGPDTNKPNGDRFATEFCDSTTFFECVTGQRNNENFGTSGYMFVIRITPDSGDLGKRLRVQAYDPAFVQQGDTCNDFAVPNSSGSSTTADETAMQNAINAVAGSTTTAYSYRWHVSNKQACPGDHWIRSPFFQLNPSTRFQFREWDDTYTTSDNEPITDTDCDGETFAAVPGQVSTAATNDLPELLTSTNGSALAVYTRRVFHTWVDLCDITLSELGITAPGQYDVLLNISTNVDDAPEDAAGHNRFALRAGLSTGSGTPSGVNVSVFASERLPIYMNASGSDTQFYLARVEPGADGRVLDVEFFDVGDAAANGTLTILPPAEATDDDGDLEDSEVTCTFNASGTISTGDGDPCQLTNVNASNGYNGQRVLASVPIPDGYDCDEDDSFGCWFRIRFQYPASTAVQDTTTWTASIRGDPVRLVE
jgi:Flp pilus assembly protein TadG